MRRIIVCMFLVVGAGCGPARGVVTGEVRVDGAPLKKGVIVFASASGADQAEIVEGLYEVKTTAGAKAVQISEDLGTEKKKEHNGPGAPWIDVPKGEGLPPRYNSASELKFDVPAGNSTKDWALSRKGT